MADVSVSLNLSSSLLGLLAGIFTAGAIEHQVRDENVDRFKAFVRTWQAPRVRAGLMRKQLRASR